MSLSKDALKKYAELGVRERLKEIQRELDALARDFPHLVKNADGSMPSVVPIVATKKPMALPTGANGNGHESDTAARIRAFLTAHPGATAQEIAHHVGLSVNSSMRSRHLQPIARYEPAGGRNPGRWFLKSDRATTTVSHAPRVSKQRQRRQASADLLAQFDTTTPRTVKAGTGKLGILIQKGYLAKKADGYIRTAKPFHVSPNGASA